MSEDNDQKKRILFVDDEPHILEGLQRMLRKYRKEWDLSFAGGGKEALELLAGTSFDVVVSDMRMPGMDGAQLFDHVRRDYPGAVRILLSGHAEVGEAMRSALCAHQFLSKPSDSETIRLVVERSCFLQARLQNGALRQVVGKMTSLPAAPRVYNELAMALADPDVGMEDVTRIVEKDAGITAKILQLVNSSFFGIARRVDSIRDAVSYLGVTTVRTLVLSYEVFQQVEAHQIAAGYSMEDEQAHAHQVASLSRDIMGGRGRGDQAYLAGLLHDLGKLVLATNMKEQYQGLSAGGPGGGGDALETERSTLGVTHDEVGAYLLGIWGMPFPIVEAVHGHHTLGGQPGQAGLDEVAAVHIADALVHEQSAPDEPSRLDLEFVRSIGKEAQLGGWREIAATLVRSSQNAA